MNNLLRICIDSVGNRDCIVSFTKLDKSLIQFKFYRDGEIKSIIFDKDIDKLELISMLYKDQKKLRSPDKLDTMVHLK